MAVKLIIKISEPELRKLVAELPEQYREVVLLYCLNNLTKKAVADKVNLSYGVTRNRLSKGIYLLKKVLKHENESED
ncbi:MAG: hypothetical protein KF741_13140 [Ferruginibacter sp.]|nr:hypothetical protein [Bacteroidota bacterium]MBX2920182.1 hypothetical protein [Ferruginibacter sp.]